MFSEFTYDNANLQIDVSDADNTTTVQRIYAWTAWIQYSSATAMANFFNAIEAVDSLNYIVDTAVVDAQLDNVAATPVIIGGGYLSRNDGTTIIAAASGSIQMDPSRAYQAVGGVTVIGLDPSKLDVAVSTRLAASGYTAPDNATITAIAGYVDTEVAAIKAKTDLIPAAPAAAGDVPTASDVADAVWNKVLP